MKKLLLLICAVAVGAVYSDIRGQDEGEEFYEFQELNHYYNSPVDGDLPDTETLLSKPQSEMNSSELMATLFLKHKTELSMMTMSGYRIPHKWIDELVQRQCGENSYCFCTSSPVKERCRRCCEGAQVWQKNLCSHFYKNRIERKLIKKYGEKGVEQRRKKVELEGILYQYYNLPKNSIDSSEHEKYINANNALRILNKEIKEENKKRLLNELCDNINLSND